MKRNKGYSSLRKGRVTAAENIYHVIFSTNAHKPCLADFYQARSVIQSMMFCEENDYAHTVAFCIMPDHVHWLVQLKSRSLDQVVRSVKQYTSKGSLKWATGFYDSGIRSPEHLITVARYIIANPKRAGMVASVRDYPHWDCEFL